MKRLLLLEDEEIMRDTMRDFLESEGFEVSAVANGKTALEILENEKMPDLILLDMKMPLMDGWEFSSRLREKFQDPAPLLIMTAAVDAAERARDIKAVDFIEKPLVLDNLLLKVKKILGVNQ